MSKKLQTGTINRDSDEAKGRFFKGRAGGKAGGVDVPNRTIDGVASTINLDRDGEIILPSAVKAGIEPFLASSRPFLTAHTHRTLTGDPGQIGWVVEMTIAETKVPCKFRFVDDPQSAAERWWRLASDPNGRGIMFSIGFIPLRWVKGSVADLVEQYPEIRPAVAAAGLADDDQLRIYTAIELLEVSAVPVPSNREAVQILAAKAAAAEAEEDVIQGFKTELAAEVVRQLDGRAGGPPAAAGITEEMLEKSLDRAVAGMRQFVREAIDDVLAVLPDDVNAAAAPEGPEAQDAADGGGGRDGAGVREAAERLRRTCES